MFAASPFVFAQSSDQNFPTPVTSSEIRGTIRARDVGDSRNTTYFYAFDGEQGDIFVNIQTKNFDGDIDVFTADNLRPMTKVVLYADAGVTETGRIIYLRKGERLLLRVEGRTPGDDAATFVVKFAGSFVALTPSTRKTDDSSPQVAASDGVRLNSVGAVIPRTEVKKPPVRVDPAAKDTSPKKERPAKIDRASAADAKDTVEPARTSSTGSRPPANGIDPLASVFLTIILKDGKKIQKSMSEVIKFSTDRDAVTLILKSGNIIRYQLSNVARVTIE